MGACRDGDAGLLRKAHGGILFLDEIGELGRDEQAMLLRAIEDKVFYPVGSDREVESDFQLLANLPLKETGTIDTKPGQGAFDLKDPRILVPGDPSRSLLLHRMKRLGLGRMPHIASNRVDTEAADLVEEWIKGLPH